MASGSSDDNARIRDQIHFYREQAGQFPAMGAHDAALQASAYFQVFLEGLGPDDFIRKYCPPSPRCLDLAAGAGRWTGPLLNVCERITAVDVSPEMHAVNRERNGDARVEYIEANIFDYQPTALFELVFAGFWLSHVPLSRFGAFWSMVEKALAPGGRVVMVDDGVRDTDGVARFAEDASGTDANRRLPDGRTFRIVKHAYAPSELEALLANLGWTAEVSLLTPVVYVMVAHR
jgi:demethylmenaquinone methyltransferase/2-methoxy-6-polyprenyl-1,4-benzoquinol methylase